jgi:5-methylcytosine-specific restriction endonuclease McrA
MDWNAFSALSDEALFRRLEALVVDERSSLIAQIACLTELDRRPAILLKGFASLFNFCLEKLHLSEDEACRRIKVARAMNDFPHLREPFEDGRLSLSVICRLANHLTPRNAEALIRSAQGKTFREIDEIVAPTKLGPPPADVIRPLRRKSEADPQAELQAELALDTRCSEAVLRYRFSFEGSRELKETLDRARAVMWHKVPAGTLETVVLEAVADYLRRHDPMREVRAGCKRKRVVSRSPRAIPRSLRSVVWRRDGGRCTFTSEHGKQCEATRSLEIDHIKPVSLGGTAEAANLRLLCRAHNQMMAQLMFDPPHPPHRG